MSPDVSRYIPSLEALVAAQCELEVQTWRHPFGIDLLKIEPTECRKLAAVVLTARVQRRRTTETETEVPVSRVQHLPEHVPERLVDDWSDREVDVVVDRLDPGTRACSYCPPTQRGFRSCAACGGIGSTAPGGGLAPCLGCQGTGRVPCESCDGTGISVRVRMQTIRDFTTRLHYAYVPAMTLSIEERLSQLLEPVDPPECLRVDLSPRRAGSAYRDVLEVDPVFEGHEFHDALTRARSTVRALGEGHPIIRQDVRAYAWPLLLLRWKRSGLDRTIALVIRPGDLAHLVVE